MNFFMSVFDFTNESVTLNIRNRKKHKSILNATLGLIMIISLISVFILIIIQYLKGKNFTVFSTIDKNSISHNNFTDMPILFNLLDIRGQPINPEGVYSLHARYRNVFFNSTLGKLQANMYDIPFSKCDSLTFPQKYIKDYEERVFPRFNCLDTSIDKTLINVFGDMKFGHSFFYIDVRKCTNNTYTKCKSSEKIDKILSRAYFGLRIPSHQIDHYKTDVPNLLDITSLNFLMSSQMVKTYRLLFEHISYETDNGLILSDISKYEFYTYEGYNVDIDFASKIDGGSNIMGSVFFQNSKGIVRYNKIYMKLQRLFSELGGFTNGLHVIYTILVYIFSRNKISLVLVNSLFEFRDKKDKEIKRIEERKSNFQLSDNDIHR